MNISAADQQHSARAFTLVELLVVIAITAILATLLLTSLGSARDRANLAVCRNNLRQCTLAMSVYVSDNGVFAADHADATWIVELLPYLGLARLIPQIGYTNTVLSNTVMSCPGFNHMPGTYAQQGSTPFGYNALGIASPTAGFSFGLIGKILPQSPIVPIRENQIVSPSDMICLADSVIVAPTGQTNNISPPFVVGVPWLIPELWFGPGSAADKYYERRHRRQHWNVSFVDVHIETKKTAALFDSSIPAIRARWNRDFQPH